MDFASAVRVCLTTKYATFAGRASRSEFWFFTLFLWVVSLIAVVIDEAILASDVGAISLIFTIATIVPSIAVNARRLHDVGRSGWWQLLILIPLLGWIALLVWWCTKSDGGENAFGPSPHGEVAPAAA